MKRIALLILLVLFIVAPGVDYNVSAQTPIGSDDLMLTPVPAATLDLSALPAAPEATEETSSGVVINIDNTTDAPATPEPAPMPDSDVRLNVWQIVLGVGSLLITGFAGGGVTFALILRGVRKDPALLAAIEGLVNSQPVERRTLIKTIGEGLKDVGELALEAADGIPAADKTPVVQGPMSDATVNAQTTTAAPTATFTFTPSVGDNAVTEADVRRIVEERYMLGTPLSPTVDDVLAFTQVGDVTPTTG